MTRQTDIDTLLTKELQNNWNNGVDIFYENVRRKNTPSEWVNFMSFMGSSQNITLGTVKNREFCSLVAEVRVPKASGTGRALDIAEDFAEIFRNKTIGIIKLFAPSMEKVSNENHYGVNVLVPYWWDRLA